MVRLIDLPQYREVKNVNPFSSSSSRTAAAEQAKNHFANSFTSAAILKADDGVNWTTETQTEEQKKQIEAGKHAAGRDLVGGPGHKTLYDQLQENKDKWQEEFDENTRKIYAPPKALDEDDVQFFDEQRASRKEKEKMMKEQALADLLEFKTAQDSRVVKAATPPAIASATVDWNVTAKNTAAKSPQRKNATATAISSATISAVTVKKRRKRKKTASNSGGDETNDLNDNIKSKTHRKKNRKEKTVTNSNLHQDVKNKKHGDTQSQEAHKQASFGEAFAMYASSSSEDE